MSFALHPGLLFEKLCFQDQVLTSKAILIRIVREVMFSVPCVELTSHSFRVKTSRGTRLVLGEASSDGF